MQRNVLAIVAAVVLLAGWKVAAEESQWPNLNPFASSKPSTLSKRVSNNSGSSWWPSLPTWGSKPAPRNAPTTWQKVQAAPGNVYKKTKETLAPLNPFPAEQKKSNKYGSPKKKKQAQSGWWPDWMTVEEEKGPPLTVTDWLSAPRPGDE